MRRLTRVILLSGRESLSFIRNHGPAKPVKSRPKRRAIAKVRKAARDLPAAPVSLPRPSRIANKQQNIAPHTEVILHLGEGPNPFGWQVAEGLLAAGRPLTLVYRNELPAFVAGFQRRWHREGKRVYKLLEQEPHWPAIKCKALKGLRAPTIITLPGPKILTPGIPLHQQWSPLFKLGQSIADVTAKSKGARKICLLGPRLPHLLTHNDTSEASRLLGLLQAFQESAHSWSADAYYIASEGKEPEEVVDDLLHVLAAEVGPQPSFRMLASEDVLA